MSLINDALNKVQKLRREKLLSEGLGTAGAVRREAKAKSTGRLPPYAWVLINATVLIVVLAGNRYFTRENPSTPTTYATPSAVPVTTRARTTTVVQAAPDSPRAMNPSVYSHAPELAPVSPAQPSPFLNPASGSASHAPSADYDLAGMTVVGKDTLLSIIRRSDQKSIWVAVGKTVGEISAVSYSADADNAVIRIRGQLFTIGMRNASVVFPPAPPASR